MTKLVDFSSDVLNRVTELLTAQTITSLSFIGNRTLNLKLSKGGALKTFEYLAASNYQAVCPSIVSQFECLTYFEYYTSASLAESAVLPSLVDVLPRRLVTLSL
jgi:hypothetical protein